MCLVPSRTSFPLQSLPFAPGTHLQASADTQIGFPGNLGDQRSRGWREGDEWSLSALSGSSQDQSEKVNDVPMKKGLFRQSRSRYLVPTWTHT